MPKEFRTYLNYCRQLDFSAEPNYQYLLEIFNELFQRQGFVRDYVYDWNIVRFQRQSHTNNEQSMMNSNEKRSKSLTPVPVGTTNRFYSID